MMVWSVRAWSAKGGTKRIKGGDKRGGNKEDIRVSFVLNRVRSRQVARDLSPWYRKRWGVCIWWFDHLQFDPAENWSAPYSDQVLRQLSPSSHHTSSVFPSLSLVQVGRFFHWQYLWSFGFLSIVLNRVPEVFYRLILLSIFPPQSSSLGWEVFYQQHDHALRLISFPTGLKRSHC